MLLFRVKSKPKDISLKVFLDEYQKLTLTFLKEIKKLQKTNEDKMIEKLMSMAACATMPEYQSFMKQDILEVLSYQNVYPMHTQVGEFFDPTKHCCRQALTNKPYVITKIHEDGFVRDNEVIQKSIVEVGGQNDE